MVRDIEMIAWFGKDGKITPIKFKLSEEGEVKVIVIDKIIKSEFQKKAGLSVWKFDCRSIINNFAKNYVIKYDTSTGRWMFFTN